MERFAIKIDKTLRANLYKICRLCGIDNPEKVKVLNDAPNVNSEDGEPDLWKKVLDCIGLLITKDDKMPQYMCTICIDKINDFFEFREMCYATDMQTRKLLGIKEETTEAEILVPPPPANAKIDDEENCEKAGRSVSVRLRRKRRNADMEICDTVKELKKEENKISVATQTISQPTPTKSSKRKRFENSETHKKLSSIPKHGINKRRIKTESIVRGKSQKIAKLVKARINVECVKQVNRDCLTLQKKRTLELLRQRKSVKSVAVKIDKVKKNVPEPKIKEQAPPKPPTIKTNASQKPKLRSKCVICTESFENKLLLEKHKINNHVPMIVRYHCVQCNETLKKSMEIKNHNLWHKLSKTPFMCGKCSEMSCSIYTYTKHIRDCGQLTQVDAQVPDWHCPECGEVFQTTYLFNIHSCVTDSLICPGCDQSFRWKEDYLKHVPTCPATIFHIPSHMTSSVKVKNEADQTNSPIGQQSVQSLQVHTSSALLSTSTRNTPPVMDLNQCVVIPGNVNLYQEQTAPSTLKKINKKNKRVTKKDLKRFDELLKSTLTTLVSIKKEPSRNVNSDEEGERRLQVQTPLPLPPSSPILEADTIRPPNPTTPDYPCTIKQEIIDSDYPDVFSNVKTNVKAEYRPPASSTNDDPTLKRKDNMDVQKPVLKLKITKEHGTLNSVLLNSPRSEKKKKKKRKKEEKDKSLDSSAQFSPTDIAANLEHSSIYFNGENNTRHHSPDFIQIKQEVVEDSMLRGNQFNSTIPNIIATTSGNLQISSVSGGVPFDGMPEMTLQNQVLVEIDDTEYDDDPIYEQSSVVDINSLLEDNGLDEPTPVKSLSFSNQTLRSSLRSSKCKKKVTQDMADTHKRAVSIYSRHTNTEGGLCQDDGHFSIQLNTDIEFTRMNIKQETEHFDDDGDNHSDSTDICIYAADNPIGSEREFTAVSSTENNNVLEKPSISYGFKITDVRSEIFEQMDKKTETTINNTSAENSSIANMDLINRMEVDEQHEISCSANGDVSFGKILAPAPKLVANLESMEFESGRVYTESQLIHSPVEQTECQIVLKQPSSSPHSSNSDSSNNSSTLANNSRDFIWTSNKQISLTEQMICNDLRAGDVSDEISCRDEEVRPSSLVVTAETVDTMSNSRTTALPLMSPIITSEQNDPQTDLLQCPRTYLTTNNTFIRNDSNHTHIPTINANENLSNLSGVTSSLTNPSMNPVTNSQGRSTLTAEIQNLLNDDVVATTTFEYNEIVLTAQHAAATNNSCALRNATDLDNVNEIAENNNNANLERELLDDLGIAPMINVSNESSHDEILDNAINEIRDNFDIN